MDTAHIELAYLCDVSANQKNLNSNFETFKEELTNILKVILEDHNVIKQELFISRQNKNINDKRMENIERAVMDLTRMASCSPPVKNPAASTNIEESPKSSVPPEKNPSSSGKTPKPSSVPENNQASSKASSPKSPSSSLPRTVPQPRSEHTYSKSNQVTSKVCIVGDSISGNLDHKVIANSMDADVRAARAYSALKDACENEAKEETRFPSKSFDNVITAEAKKTETEILIVQAGSVDITNLKTTNENNKKFSEYFRQETVISATNLFTSVSNALKANPHLKEVIIMKQTPRYDTLSKDPQGIKAALALLYNNTIVQLWLASPQKDMITLGNHDLECSGGVRDARYKLGNRYDGYHLHGPAGKKAFTESVLLILRKAGHIKSPPPKYFRRFHKVHSLPSTKQDTYHCPTQDTDYKYDRDIRNNEQTSHTEYQYAVPTANRFNSFNQENC